MTYWGVRTDEGYKGCREPTESIQHYYFSVQSCICFSKPALIDTKPVPEPIQGSGIETDIDGKACRRLMLKVKSPVKFVDFNRGDSNGMGAFSKFSANGVRQGRNSGGNYEELGTVKP
ncbi:hypothetical protein M0802_014888 [Mischocyttarus mexicanus]|nr:hypothetical protein M0802_014888 [Mischocyttarus mexicanus]